MVKKPAILSFHPLPFLQPARRWFATLLFVTLCLFAPPLPVRAEPVDRIVAAVNNEVITASDLAHAVALNARLGGNGAGGKALEADTLEGLITRSLLVQEARRLRFVEISDADINTEAGKIRKRFGTDQAFEAFLAEQGLSLRELSRMLGERLLVERFVEKKVGLFVRVSRDEAQAYYNEHAAEFRGKSFQDVLKNLSAFLTERKIGQQLDQYVAELRAKAEIRMNARREDRLPAQ